MRLAVSALAAASLLTASAGLAAGAWRHSGQWAADVPMEDCDGTPCIDARIGQGPAVRVLIDTGNVSSIIDTADVPQPAPRRVAADVAIGGETLHGVSFAPLPLGQFVTKGEMPRARATLAYAAFKDRVIQLDFPQRRVRITPVLSEAEACSGPCAPLHLITFGSKGPPILVADGFSADSKPLTAQIDTLYTGALLIYTPSVAKLGFSATATTSKTEMFPFTDGGVRMRVAENASAIAFMGVPLVAQASVFFPTSGVHEPDGLFDATAGLDLMRHAAVTLDLKAMTITIVPTKG